MVTLDRVICSAICAAVQLLMKGIVLISSSLNEVSSLNNSLVLESNTANNVVLSGISVFIIIMVSIFLIQFMISSINGDHSFCLIIHNISSSVLYHSTQIQG